MYSRPALLDLISRTLNDVTSRLSNLVLRRSNAVVYARALAGLANGLYGYIDWLSQQLIYDTATGYFLERWASIWGLSRLLPQSAIGMLTFSGSDGAPIPVGTTLSGYDGTLWNTTAAGAIAAGVATVPVIAVEPGAAGNRAGGQTFTIQAPLSGVNAAAISSAMRGGTDLEADDNLRSRLLYRIQNPPQGGAWFDYVEWATDYPGVTRAWCFPLELGAGTVVVRFMMDGTYSDGIPLSADVTALQTYIANLAPITATVTVLAPVANPLNVKVTGLNPNSAATQAAVIAELSTLIAREATPGGNIAGQVNAGGVMLWSHIDEAIGLAAGVNDFALTLPTGNVTNVTGAITTLGTVTWA